MIMNKKEFVVLKEFEIPEGYELPELEKLVNWEFFKNEKVDKNWINDYFENILKESIDH